ncbi:MAG: ATP-binding cassette domain-containing protein, partial [Ornithinimicrobium sp.]
ARRAAREYLELVQVAELADRRSRELSGGQEQRVAVARALAARPSILLLDEPFGALDIAVRESLYEVLTQIREHLGPTIVMVTHDLAEAGLADRVAILDGGCISADGELAELYAAPANVQVARLLGGFTEISGQVHAGIHHSAAGRVRLPAGCEVADGGAVLLVHRQGLRLEPCPAESRQQDESLAVGSSPAVGGSPEVGDLVGQVTDVRTAGLRLRLTILLDGAAAVGRPAHLEAEVDGGAPWVGAAPGMRVRIRPGVPGVWVVPATSTLRP